MRRLRSVRLSWTCALAVAGMLLVTGLNQADARPQYYQAFLKKYEKAVETNEVKTKVKCNVCHVAGKAKKMRNVYGTALSKHVTKKNEKDGEKIEEAFVKAEKDKSAIEGKTFGDLLKDGKLPDAEE